MRRWSTYALLSAAASSAALDARPANAAAVVVFPLDARGVAKDTADTATEHMKATLKKLGQDVIETVSVERRLGVHLTEQARACEYDVFCLVEVGEILQSERMIIGHVRKTPKDQPADEVELKLFVLDVAKASVVDVLLWRVPNRDRGLEEAVQAATRRLFSAPDAELVLEMRPSNAEVSFYGDPVPKANKGVIKYWSGAYQARIRAEGFQTLDQRIVINPGGKTTLPIELQPDLLYVAKPKDKAKSNPFDRASRREGSGVTAQEAGAEVPDEDDDGGSSALANPFAWGLAGVGIAGAVAGILISSGAQSDYNSLSKQQRYLPGVTLSATQSIENREDERSRYRLGSAIAVSGVAVAAGGVLWMIIDAATASAPTARATAASAPRVSIGLGSASLEVPW